MDGSGGVAQWQCHGLEHILALFWLPLIGRSDADVRNCACPSLKCVGVSTVHSGEEREGGGVQWRGNENVSMLKLMWHAKITLIIGQPVKNEAIEAVLLSGCIFVILLYRLHYSIYTLFILVYMCAYKKTYGSEIIYYTFVWWRAVTSIEFSRLADLAK